MNEINLKKIFFEIKDSKFLLIAITFSTLLIGLLLQNFFKKYTIMQQVLILMKLFLNMMTF